MTVPNTPAEQAVPETPQVPETGTTPPAEQPQEEPKVEPKYVTEEQLASILAENKNDIIKDVNMRSKQRARQIKEQVTNIEKTLQASGIDVTPEQKEKIQTQVAASYSDDDEGEQPVGNQPNLEDQPQEIRDALDLAYMRLPTVDFGTGVKEFDEILKPVLDEAGRTGDYSKIVATTDRAIDAYKARNSANKEKAILRVPTGSGGGGGEAPAQNSNDYRKRLSRERGK